MYDYLFDHLFFIIIVISIILFITYFTKLVTFIDIIIYYISLKSLLLECKKK